MTPGTNIPPLEVDDPLDFLPCTPVRAYKKNKIIYDPEVRHQALYLVLHGRVKVSRFAEGGKEIADFYGNGEFFGEMAFLGTGGRGEQAVALKQTLLRRWTNAELQRWMTRTPVLGLALLRVLAEKLVEAENRIESLCLDPVGLRLGKALLHLGERLGRPAEDHILHLPPLSHEHLAQYVGTSREIITRHMNRFRRDHLLTYSRDGIEVGVAALRQHLFGTATRISAEVPSIPCRSQKLCVGILERQP